MSQEHQSRVQSPDQTTDAPQEQVEPQPNSTEAQDSSGAAENLPGAERFEAIEPVGHTAADRALADLADLPHRPVADHAAMYQRAHDQLTQALEAPVNAIQVPGD